MEFVPYVGPVLGAVPPVIIALFTSPVTALWVIVAFVAIHQFEGHIVVPKIMGGAVGVHPLVVIFGLLIGEQLYGLVGILLAIPVVVILKETVVYASDRFGLARWRREQGAPDPQDSGSPAPPAAAGLAAHRRHASHPAAALERRGHRRHRRGARTAPTEVIEASGAPAER